MCCPWLQRCRKKPVAEALDELLYLVRYDLHLRQLVVEKGGLDSDMLDFLFGCPLTETLKSLGIKIRQEAGKLVAGA